VDLVFIDAGHTYDYVKRDTDQALTMLRPGGVIVWHDCFQVLHPDVTRRLCELAEEGMAIHHFYNTNLAVCVGPRSG
jgi:predicted O-methyltransferase YrrM